jgi:hypothetical protein
VEAVGWDGVGSGWDGGMGVERVKVLGLCAGCDVMAGEWKLRRQP